MLQVDGWWSALAVMALADGAISTTIARSRAFEGARRWVADRSSLAGDLVSCPYCVSHWVAFALWAPVAASVTAWWVLSLATVAASVPVVYGIRWALAHPPEEEEE